jgi:hypothetical protein
MTHFKHIIILVSALLAFGLTANAQSTSRYPYEGSMHTYTCNGISVGAGYQFYITASANGNGVYDDGLTGEFDIKNAKGTVGSDGLATTDIQWNNGASQHIYYLWLEATAPGGCSNYIQIQITPLANQFDILSENVPVTNTRSCPAVTESDGFNALTTAYDAGKTTLRFLVKREYGTENKLTPETGDTYNWSFIPLLVVDPDIVGLSNVIISIEGSTSGVLTADADNRYMVSGFDNEVLVTVSIQNAPGTIRDVTLQITRQGESNTNLSDSDPSNDNVTHTIQVMPLIEGMSGV